jgi:hypothetical protein
LKMAPRGNRHIFPGSNYRRQQKAASIESQFDARGFSVKGE